MPRNLFIVLFSLLALTAHSLSVTKSPDQSTTLSERWQWAQQHLTKKDVWVAYSIEQSMPENELVGSFYGGRERFPTIYEVLTGNKRAFQPNMKTTSDIQITGTGHMKLEGRGNIVSREIAMLFGYRGNNMDNVEVSMIDLQFDFRHRDLIWLGNVSQEESIKFLQGVYKKEAGGKLAEDLLDAIGIHHRPALVTPILQEVLNSRTKDDLRAKAAFWLGNENDPDALKILVSALKNEKSEDVIEEGLAGLSEMTLPEGYQQLKEWTKPSYSQTLREHAIFWMGQKEAPGTLEYLEKIAMEDTNEEILEKAIFSMSEMHETPGVTQTLIRIARTHPSREGRKQAIFWLSQNYTEKIEETLKDFASNDKDREIQKQAIFALSELDNGAGVPELIQLAKTHKDPAIRKQAIFWLGESDDERAHQALLKIIEEDGDK
ncbi:MAG TPA: HEAT repeat domain-containing protein [Acidobacteriota bacterium]